MNIKQLLEALEQINEMAIKPWKSLPSKGTPEDCVNAILAQNQDRVNILLNNSRKDRQLPSPDPQEKTHRIGCQCSKKLFDYNGQTYYFGILWGEEDKMGHNKILQGNGIAHILVNHKSNFTNIIKNLNSAIKSINPKTIHKDRQHNLEIIVRVNHIKYVLKNYTELNDNFFYLHTAY